MIDTMNIEIEQIENSKLTRVDFDDIQFGKVYSDHMFISKYRKGEWGVNKILPYRDLSISPASPSIHYGQSIFEGMKAYRSPEGEILLFRPLDNFKRLNISADRMCMPHISEEVFMEGLSQLIKLDEKWVPSAESTSLYIRPFMFSADEYIGIRPSDDFDFMIITCPVGKYYSKPVRVKIETKYARAVEGGTGYAKAGGNYGGSLYPAKLAQEKGYDQLIWTDGKEHKYIEEAGTMNVLFVLDDVLVTAPAGDTILKGITRDSVLTLARDWGMKVEERKLEVTELIDAIKSGRLKEAFGAGTAATIAHIATIGHEGVDYDLPKKPADAFSNRILNELDAIRTGRKEDKFGWVYKVK
ncbi:MAG: branched-chain amino acid aminotransferase [Cyclobacteriaceae bacterium]|nr:branched-chain amino acid aminotransferase [Cyclobacteriaceae bacterium]